MDKQPEDKVMNNVCLPRELVEQALRLHEAQLVNENYDHDGCFQKWDEHIALEMLVAAYREALSQQSADCHQLKPLTDDDFYVVPEDKSTPEWTVWVCPKPKGYLMKCCDCGLVHEVDFRVVKYDPRPSEEFSVISDPDLQAQFRMRRYDK